MLDNNYSKKLPKKREGFVKNKSMKNLIVVMFILTKLFSQSFEFEYGSFNDDSEFSGDEVDPFIVIDNSGNVGLCYTRLGHSNMFGPSIKYAYEGQGAFSWVMEEISPYSSGDFLESKLHYIDSNRVLSFRYNSDFDNSNYLSSGTWFTSLKSNSGNWQEDNSGGTSFAHTSYVNQVNDDEKIHFLTKTKINNIRTLLYYKRNANGSFSPTNGYQVASSNDLRDGPSFDLTVMDDDIPYFCYIQGNYVKAEKYGEDPIIVGTINVGNITFNRKLMAIPSPTISYIENSNILMIVYSDFDNDSELWTLFYSIYNNEYSMWSTPQKVIENTSHMTYPYLTADINSGDFFLSFYSFNDLQSSTHVYLNVLGYSFSDGNYGDNPIQIDAGEMGNDGMFSYYGRPIHSRVVTSANEMKLFVSSVFFSGYNDTDVRLYQIVFPNSSQYAFRNMVIDEEAEGGLKLTNNLTGTSQTIETGSFRTLTVGNNYSIETLPRRFIDYYYQGIISDYQHHHWNSNKEKYFLSTNFYPSHFISKKDAVYNELYSISVFSNPIGLLANLQDPWYVRVDGTQTGTDWLEVEGGSYEVFLNQSADNPPYYSLRAPKTFVNTNGIYEFENWKVYKPDGLTEDIDGEYALLTDPENYNSCPVIFYKENAAIKPEYRALHEIENYTLTIGIGELFSDLTIYPGASIEFAPGFKIKVLGRGTLNLLGNQENPIVLTSNGSGNWDGIDVRNDGVVNMSHVTLKHANNGLKYGFWDNVTSNPPDKYINNANFEDNETAVLVEFRNGANFVQSDVYVNGCTFDGNISGIKFEHNTQYPPPTLEQTNAFISNSTFTNNDVGISLQRNTDYVDIVGSQFHGNNKGIDIFIEWSSAERLNHHFDVSYNVFTENNDGIFVYTDCPNGALSIHNNTFYSNSSNVFSPTSEDQFDTRLFNNIVHGGYEVYLDVGDQIHHNDFWETYNTYYPEGGAGNINADPLFVDAANGNYTLQPSSPCINAGDPDSPLDPDGTRADIGAFPFLHYSGEVSGELADGYTLHRNVIISGDVVIPENASVTVTPNTVIAFEPESNLNVEGNLISDGTDGPISFALNGNNINVTGEAEFVNTSFTNGKLHFEGETGSGSVYSSSFTDATLVVNEGAFANVRNTSFSGGTVGLFTSGINTSPEITNCTFSDHNLAIISHYHSSPVIRGCTLSNSGVGLHAAESAVPNLTNGENSLRACTFKNNTIKECGIAVQAWRHSTANLGHGLYERPTGTIFYDLLGYNTIHSNGSLFDNERSTIYAIGNNWSSQSCSYTVPYNPADTPENIFWEPVLAELVPAPDIANIDELFENASKLEAMGEFEAALDIYTQVVLAVPNDKLGELSLYGLARCYKAMEQEEAMILALVSISEQFPGTGVHKHAHSLLSSHKIKDGDLALLTEAEGHIHTIRTEYPNNEMEPKLLYEEFLIAKKRGNVALGRATPGSNPSLAKEEIYRKLKENYPDSPFTFLVGLESGGHQKKHKNAVVPQGIALHPAYPNPFNPTTTIRFDVPASAGATPLQLRVYDITGRLVETLLNGQLSSGSHKITWDAKNHSTGIYFIELTAGNERHTQKVVLMK